MDIVLKHVTSSVTTLKQESNRARKCIHLRKLINAIPAHPTFASLKSTIFEKKKIILLAVTTIVLTSQALLLSTVATSHIHEENVMPMHMSISLLFELTKLIISATFLFLSLRTYQATDDNPQKQTDSSSDESEDDTLPRTSPSTSDIVYAAPTQPPPLPITWDWADSKYYFVPAFVYLINDNLLFYILSSLDPVTFEILGNLRILTTSFWYRIFFQKKINVIQYASLVLLCVGMATSQLASVNPASATPASTTDLTAVTVVKNIISNNLNLNNGSSATVNLFHTGASMNLNVPFKGLVLSLIYCALSGFAGVYIEYLMKSKFLKSSKNFYYQNVQLYAYGVILNALPLVTFYSKELITHGLFGLAGQSYLIVLVVLNHGLVGLSLSALLKFADNFARVYAHSVSMLLTIVIVSIMGKRLPSLQVIFGMIVVVTSIYLYYLPIEKLYFETQKYKYKNSKR